MNAGAILFTPRENRATASREGAQPRPPSVQHVEIHRRRISEFSHSEIIIFKYFLRHIILADSVVCEKSCYFN